jgi:hypothetical protein
MVKTLMIGLLCLALIVSVSSIDTKDNTSKETKPHSLEFDFNGMSVNIPLNKWFSDIFDIVKPWAKGVRDCLNVFWDIAKGLIFAIISIVCGLCKHIQKTQERKHVVFSIMFGIVLMGLLQYAMPYPAPLPNVTEMATNFVQFLTVLGRKSPVDVANFDDGSTRNALVPQNLWPLHQDNTYSRESWILVDNMHKVNSAMKHAGTFNSGSNFPNGFALQGYHVLQLKDVKVGDEVDITLHVNHSLDVFNNPTEELAILMYDTNKCPIQKDTNNDCAKIKKTGVVSKFPERNTTTDLYDPGLYHLATMKFWPNQVGFSDNLGNEYTNNVWYYNCFGNLDWTLRIAFFAVAMCWWKTRHSANCRTLHIGFSVTSFIRCCSLVIQEQADGDQFHIWQRDVTILNVLLVSFFAVVIITFWSTPSNTTTGTKATRLEPSGNNKSETMFDFRELCTQATTPFKHKVFVFEWCV